MELKLKIRLVYHIPFKNVIHNLMPRQTSSIHQQLKREFQTRVHFPPPRLSLAFFASSLRFRRVHSLKLIVAIFLIQFYLVSQFFLIFLLQKFIQNSKRPPRKIQKREKTDCLKLYLI